jgi:hypothetical protein
MYPSGSREIRRLSLQCDPDPVERPIGVFMTEFLPFDVYPLQVEIRELTYRAVREGGGRRLYESPN